MLHWNILVSGTACPVFGGDGGGGGGGGGSGPVCIEKWGCQNWNECKDAPEGLRVGFLTGEEFRIVKKSCGENFWNEALCGYQNRICEDVNICGTVYSKEETVQACHFVLNPSCSDGVKNCHDGECEFLVDCGGSCRACATCSDRIQNQGEEVIDCGGPCPYNCPSQTPRREIPLFYWIAGLIILVLLIIVVIRIYQIRKLREKAGISMGNRNPFKLR